MERVTGDRSDGVIDRRYRTTTVRTRRRSDRYRAHLRNVGPEPSSELGIEVTVREREILGTATHWYRTDQRVSSIRRLRNRDVLENKHFSSRNKL
ncbi:hypothetical protein D8S78_11285 [Natrialba swarupiae]|nr:hypothetical protein [Natrialba swarupiae]